VRSKRNRVKATRPSAAKVAAETAPPLQAKRGAAPRPAQPAKRSSAPRRARSQRPRRSTQEPAPRQGFESDSETSRGSVAPPGGPELVSAAVEIVGELAKASLSTGERLVKDVLSRLPLN
jgi:hypothetical protein